MFNFIFQHFYQKPSTRETFSYSNDAALSPERIMVSIDYNQLAEALISAQEKAAVLKKEKAIEEQQEEQLAWEKALCCSRYTGNNCFIKILFALVFPLRLTFGVVFFRKKNATFDRGTYFLMNICCEFLLSVYGTIFYIASLCCGIALIDYFCPWFEITPLPSPCLSLTVGFPCLIIASIIRIANLETHNLRDKSTIRALFNALVAFTAMIFGIVAVIIALNTGGVCACAQ